MFGRFRLRFRYPVFVQITGIYIDMIQMFGPLIRGDGVRIICPGLFVRRCLQPAPAHSASAG